MRPRRSSHGARTRPAAGPSLRLTTISHRVSPSQHQATRFSNRSSPGHPDRSHSCQLPVPECRVGHGRQEGAVEGEEAFVGRFVGEPAEEHRRCTVAPSSWPSWTSRAPVWVSAATAATCDRGGAERRRGPGFVVVLHEPDQAVLVFVVRRQVQPHLLGGPCRMRS